MQSLLAENESGPPSLWKAQHVGLGLYLSLRDVCLPRSVDMLQFGLLVGLYLASSGSSSLLRCRRLLSPPGGISQIHVSQEMIKRYFDVIHRKLRTLGHDFAIDNDHRTAIILSKVSLTFSRPTEE